MKKGNKKVIIIDSLLVDPYSVFEEKLLNLVMFFRLDQTVQWDIDFYPRGIRYGKAQIINVFNMPGSLEIPEALLRTVRLSVTCKSDLENDRRFMV